MKIGFIGLGIMGRHMARNLAKHGHALCLLQYRSPLPQELLDTGATVFATSREVALNSNIVILMLPNTPDVESVLFAAGGVTEGLFAGKVVIDMSSIDPIATRRFAERVGAAGARYADAPVSGGEIAARDGTLSVMVGADDETFAIISPVLDTMARSVTLIGDVGAGQTAKVANQIVVGVTISAVSEALAFAKRAGVDPARVREALLGGFASSRILDVHGRRMLEEDFAPGFRIRLQSKDLGLALAAGQALDLPLPQTASCDQLFLSAIAQGDGDLDHSALFRTYSRLIGAFEEEIADA